MVIVGTLLAAAKGVVGATTVTMGLIMLPAMLRFGYDPRLAAGTVAATATLAQIFPPATVLVLLGDQLGNAYQAAQLSKGIFAPASVTVSDLFAGALVPGFALVALYLLFLIAVAIAVAEGVAGAATGPEGAARPRAGVAGSPRCWSRRLLLIAAVLGSILGGIATPTEAASIGAVGAIAAGGAQSAAHRTAWTGLREDRADRQHDFPDPDRRHHVQPGVSRARRRRHGASRALGSAGREHPARCWR